MSPYNFPASPCSMHHWIKCLQPDVASSVLLCFLGGGRGGQVARVTSVFPSMTDFLDLAGITSTGLFLRTCPSAELYSTKTGSGLVL